MQSLSLVIDGMTCDHCIAAVTSALEQVPGVTVERVEIGRARIMYEPKASTVSHIVDAVQDAGYDAFIGGTA
jgi:copper chaperone CopZ